MKCLIKRALTSSPPPWLSQNLMHGRLSLIIRPREASVKWPKLFDRLVWPDFVIANINQHWARARSVVGLSGQIGRQYQKLHRASVSHVEIRG